VEPRPIAPGTWEKLPPEVQASILILENALRQSLDNIAQLEQKVNELEDRLNRHAAATIIGRCCPWVHRLLIKQEVGHQRTGMSKI
jgi:cell division septum initiation protein DivIVA